MLVGYAVLIVLRFAGRKRGNLVHLDLRRIAAVWLLPWFAAMALISWLCDPESHPELFARVFLTNVVVAVAIYYLAMRFRLPKAATEERIRETEEEAADATHN